MDGLPRQRGSGLDARVTGSSGRRLLLLLSRRRRRLLPCPTGSYCCSAARCCPGRGDVPSRARGEAKAKRCGGERGREDEKERESQTQSGSTNGISGCPASGDNKQAWSLLSRAGGRGKGQKVWKGATRMSSETAAVAAPFPVFPGHVPWQKSLQHTSPWKSLS